MHLNQRLNEQIEGLTRLRESGIVADLVRSIWSDFPVGFEYLRWLDNNWLSHLWTKRQGSISIIIFSIIQNEIIHISSEILHKWPPTLKKKCL